MALSPINQRRWARFRANRRGWYALWIFLVLFVVSLGAELVANDRPLLVWYDGSVYVPLVQSVPETEFGGEFETETVYRDPWVRERIESDGWMLWPPIRYSYETIRYDLPEPAPTAPDGENWLGTDDMGRDVAARIIYGFRISVVFALLLTVASSILGVVVAALQGYFGGRIDLYGQRFVEIWAGLPMLYIIIIASALIEPNFWWLLLIMLAFQWVTLVGVVRAEVLRARNFDYVRAARALGAGHMRVLFRHVLPNAMVATITFLPFIMNGSITTLTSLDFLGFGLPPGSPSLGELLQQGKDNLHAPWLGISAFLSLAVLLSLLIFIGEAARDAFDPRKRVPAEARKPADRGRGRAAAGGGAHG